MRCSKDHVQPQNLKNGGRETCIKSKYNAEVNRIEGSEDKTEVFQKAEPKERETEDMKERQ